MIAVHHRPVRMWRIRLQEIPSPWPGHDARLRIGEVALGLVVGHPGMLVAFSRSSFRSARATTSSAAKALR